MSAEFRDITVRVPVRDMEVFNMGLGLIPEATVVGEKEYLPHPKLAKWKEELDQTQLMVDRAKEATERLDSVCLQGYVKLWKELGKFARFKNLGLGMEEFVKSSMELFSGSVDEYKKQEPARLYGSTTQKRYPIVQGFLNPREVRLIIAKYGFTGKTMSGEEIKKSENISSVSNTVGSAIRHFVWSLEAKVRLRAAAN